MHKKRISLFAVEIFFGSQCQKKIVKEPCFKKTLVSKIFMHGRGGHHGFVENFLSHRTEKLRKGSLLRFRNFLVWKKIMDKRWGVSQFSVGNFSSHSAKKFRSGTLLYFKKILVSKILMNRRGASWFYRFFLSHRTKRLREGSRLCLRNFLVWKKVYG